LNEQEYFMEIFWKFWWPVIIWSGVIFTFSSIPYLKGPKIGLGYEDKICHFIEFFIWGIIFIWRAGKVISAKTVIAPSTNPLVEKIFLMLLVGIIFAFVDEFHQKWIPGRGFDRYDLFSDIMGLGFSLLIWVIFKKGGSYV